MTETSNDNKSDMSQEYAKRIDEALASLSNEDRMLIDGVRFKILQDVDEKIAVMRILSTLDQRTILVQEACADIEHQVWRQASDLKFQNMRLSMLTVLSLVLTACLSLLVGATVTEFTAATERNRAVQRGFLRVKAAIAETDQLWCRYDLSQALHGHDQTPDLQGEPDVMRPDEARLGPRTGPLQSHE